MKLTNRHLIGWFVLLFIPCTGIITHSQEPQEITIPSEPGIPLASPQAAPVTDSINQPQSEGQNSDESDIQIGMENQALPSQQPALPPTPLPEDLLHSAAFDFFKASYKKALGEVDKVLEQEPENEQAKKLKEKIEQYIEQQEQQQQQQQQQQQNQEQNEEQQQQEQEQQQQQQSEEQKEQQGEQQEQQGQMTPTPGASAAQVEKSDKEDQQQEGQQGEVVEVSAEEAKRILDALEDKEEEAMKEKQKLRARGRPQVDKDW